jgi:hypothetical protein
VIEPSAHAAAPHSQATLSRELADFLIELSIALHKHAMYPDGHPSLTPATERVIERLSRALQDRASLSLGVARNQLVIEGVATDPKNPVLQDLAGRMHRHHLGAVTFERGTTPVELDEVLALLAVEADRSAQPLGLGPREQLTAWQHIQLHPLAYERLNLIEDVSPDVIGRDAAARENRTRAAQLWLGLARAAMAADTSDSSSEEKVGLGSSGEDSADANPSDVAEAIQAHGRGTAYDQVIVGYLLQIADEVKGGSAEDEQTLRVRVSQLISELDTSTLGRLLEMGGDRLQRRQFMLNASDGLAVDAVIDLVKAAGQIDQENVSHSMLRMLTKLAKHTHSASERRRELADQSVREQVAEMVRGWSLDDPNPEAYRAALQGIATSGHQGLQADMAHSAEPERVLRMALELDATGAGVSGAVRRLVSSGDLGAVTRALEQSASGAAVDAVWQELTSSDVIRQIVTAEPCDFERLDLLLPRAGMAAAEPMLDGLTMSDSSQTRRALLDRLIAMGQAVGPLVLQRLQDGNWFVQRNMLVILRGLQTLPAGFDPRPLTEHADARVRREALRLMFDDATKRDWAVCRALTDADERTVRMGLGVAAEACPDAAVPLAASLAMRGVSEDQRVMAVHALATAGTSMALDVLMALASGKKSFWRRRTTRTPEGRAALAALRAFADRPQVRDLLAQLDGT